MKRVFYSSEGDPIIVTERGFTSSIVGVGEIDSKLSAKAEIRVSSPIFVGEISAGLTADYRVSQGVHGGRYVNA